VLQDIVYIGQAKVGHDDIEAANINTLWRSDGTAAGTQAVDVGSYDGAVKGVAAIPGGVVFVTQGIDDPNTHIYGLDNVSAHLISSKPAFPYLQGGGKAIFGCGSFDEGHLCASGVQVGSALDVTPASMQFNQLSEIGAINGGAITALVHAPSQPELWRSDGTAPGTYFLAPLSNNPFGFTLSNVIGNELYFVGCKLQEGCAFYATSGAPGSVREVAPGVLPRGKLQKIGSRLLFGTGVSQGNEQLWSTDGTAAGTTLLLDFGDSYGTYGVSQSGVGHVVLWNDGAAAYWTTDGTVAGTRLVQNWLPFTPMQNEIWAGPDFDSVLFQCYRPDWGPELCTANGSTGSPHMLADIYPGEGGSNPQYINRTSHGVFFSADDGHHGRELWIVEALPETIFASGFEP